MTYEMTVSDGDHVETFDTFEAAEKYAHTVLGVRQPFKTGPHIEADGHTFFGYYMSREHAKAVEADKGEGGLLIHVFSEEEA